MRQGMTKVSENKEFIASDRWKCEKSPSGAHYWMIDHRQMTCKHCSSIKQIESLGY
jgi:hypothetical protein